MRALLLDVGGGDNLRGQVEPLAQVVETLGGQGVVVCGEANQLGILNELSHALANDGRSILPLPCCEGGAFRQRYYAQYCHENWVLT